MSYIKKVRSKLGSAKFIHPAARIIIENGQGQVLFIKKRGSGQLGIPAGGMEENETIEQCIKREVREETGLTIHSLEVLGISSNPTQETVTYSNGDCIQYFTVEFYTKDWSGTIKVEDGEEILSAAFLPKEMYTALPKIEQSIFKSFDYYRETGRICLK